MRYGGCLKTPRSKRLPRNCASWQRFGVGAPMLRPAVPRRSRRFEIYCTLGPLHGLQGNLVRPGDRGSSRPVCLYCPPRSGSRAADGQRYPRPRSDPGAVPFYWTAVSPRIPADRCVRLFFGHTASFMMCARNQARWTFSMFAMVLATSLCSEPPNHAASGNQRGRWLSARETRALPITPRQRFASRTQRATKRLAA